MGTVVKQLFFGAAAAAEAEDFDHRLREIKAARQLPGQAVKIDKISFDVVHRFAAPAHQVMMRFEIAIHPQRGRMGSDLSQQPTVDEEPKIVVDRGERNGWNAAADRGVNLLRGIVPVGSDDGLIHDLTLVGDRQTVLRRQLAELFMGEAHNYRIRMSINDSGRQQRIFFRDRRGIDIILGIHDLSFLAINYVHGSTQSFK